MYSLIASLYIGYRVKAIQPFIKLTTEVKPAVNSITENEFFFIGVSYGLSKKDFISCNDRSVLALGPSVAIWGILDLARIPGKLDALTYDLDGVVGIPLPRHSTAMVRNLSYFLYYMTD